MDSNGDGRPFCACSISRLVPIKSPEPPVINIELALGQLYSTTFDLVFQFVSTGTTTIRMKHKTEKPAPEAKALSLFLMAYKSTSKVHKEKSKRINRLWGLVLKGELSQIDYMQQVQSMLTLYGGYNEVVEKTVKYYIDKTGEWTLQGDDQYCIDALAVADRMLKK